VALKDMGYYGEEKRQRREGENGVVRVFKSGR
jgi:hypothetical protein